MCQVSNNKGKAQLAWHSWTPSVGAGRKEANSTQQTAGESIITAICDSPKRSAGHKKENGLMAEVWAKSGQTRMKDSLFVIPM